MTTPTTYAEVTCCGLPGNRHPTYPTYSDHVVGSHTEPIRGCSLCDEWLARQWRDRLSQPGAMEEFNAKVEAARRSLPPHLRAGFLEEIATRLVVVNRSLRSIVTESDYTNNAAFWAVTVLP